MGDEALRGHHVERAAVTEKTRRRAGECLPAPYRDIDVARLQLHPQANSASLLGCNQRRAAADKGADITLRSEGRASLIQSLRAGAERNKD